MVRILTVTALVIKLLTFNYPELDHVKKLNNCFVQVFYNLDDNLIKGKAVKNVCLDNYFFGYYFHKDAVYSKLSNKEYSEKFDYTEDAKKKIVPKKDLKVLRSYLYFVSTLFVIVSCILVLALYSLYRVKTNFREVCLKNKDLVKSKNNIERKLELNKVLLSEVHHRIKNNLQMVISLLNIQSRRNKDITVEDFLEKAEARIGVLAAIHESLSQHNNEERVSLQKYFRKLACNILKVNDREEITISIETNEIFCGINTSVSLGLIINELISNSIKHAFTGAGKGEIIIDVIETSDSYYNLIFSDDGVGNSFENKSDKALGLYLVNMLVMQIDGTMEIIDSPGLSYDISFKDDKKI
jgi:two-component sensor histidine kinase